MPCIFCASDTFDGSLEHVLPESLGGKLWACLPSGLVCTRCNQYFGSKVEALALNSYPLLPFRLLLGVPTKRGKPVVTSSPLGELSSGPNQGTLSLLPRNPDVAAAAGSGRISQLRLLAEPIEPLAVCRLLVKMGLEVIAKNDPDLARSARFDQARSFARAPRRGQAWWFFVACDHERLFRRFTAGVTEAEWRDGVHLETIEVEDAEVFHLRLMELSLMTPLDPRIEAAPELSASEPAWRLFRVTV